MNAQEVRNYLLPGWERIVEQGSDVDVLAQVAVVVVGFCARACSGWIKIINQ